MLKFELQTACAGPLCAAISGRGTISAAPDAECGGEVLLSISKTDGKERQARQCGGSTRGGKQSGPSENHPQNNLYQNSFCQQILWRESPFRQKNLLMHFRAHINSTGALSPQPTNKRLETHTGQCYACLLRVLWSFFLCLDLFLHGV